MNGPLDGVRELTPNAPSSDDTMRLDVSNVLTSGEVFADRYQIHEEIGRGSFGIVYRAFDRGPLQRMVALKTVRLPAQSDPQEAALARRRFLDEARVAGNLSHTNIATVFDVTEHRGTVYMTQELAPGRDLGRIMRDGRSLTLRRTLAIVRQVCDGLAFAHARGIVHRDIKPGNIVVDEDDRVKLTDFGIAQPFDRDTTVTLAVGTPGYAAPEQLVADRVDPRADVFSVGCLLYEMLTGRRAFEGSTMASVIDKTLHALPPAPSGIREDLPRALDRVVERALRKNRDERYRDVTVLAQELVHYAQFEHLVDPAAAASDLVPALEAGQCLLFFGLHLPATGSEISTTSVDVLGELLAEQLGSPRGGRSLARLSQDLEIQNGRAEMLRLLAVALRSPHVSPREIARKVARLPFPVIVTTRYDTFLEEEIARAGRRVHRVVDCRKVPDDAGEQELIVQLFGTIEDEASIVITEDDLWNFFERFQLLSDSLKSLLARRTILFAGYDAEDEGFRHLVMEIARFRPGVTGGWYLPVSDTSLAAVRWSQSKGLRLVDAEPGAFFSLLEQSLTDRRRQSAVQPEAAAPRLPGRPYKFLNYFDSDDESIFFGRRAEVSKLVSKIHAYPLNVLYAASGCGKTSLVCAGVIPLLRREGDIPVYVRVFDDPAGEIRRAAGDASGRVDVRAEAPLSQVLAALAVKTGKRIVIFVDQFEELFVRHDREARDRFAAAIDEALVLGKGQVRFVLSLRADFLARVSEFRERMPTIFHNELRLDRLSNEACRSAISEPAKLFGIDVDSALIDRLLQDLSNEGIDPPQLQIVCDTLFDALGPGDKRITLESYLDLGGTRKILTNYLERVLRESPPSERESTREVLKQLVTAEDTKTVLRTADLARLAARSETEVLRILADLSNRRLIREVQREEGSWHELSHEYLVQEIARWLSDQEKELKRVRELLEQAVRNRRNLGILMPRPQIQLVRQHEDDLAMSKEEKQLLRDSEQALQTKRKTLVAAGVAAVLVLLIAGLSGRYIYLTTHRFIQPRDNELVEVQRGRKTAHRLEDIRVFAGSPAPSWFDPLLGFPRFQSDTDFELSQIDPARRDRMKAGVLFGRGANLENEIAGMLQPVERVRFLITSGRTEEAARLLAALYRQPSVDRSSLDRLTTLAGYSGIADPQVVQAAVRHAFSPVANVGPSAPTDNLTPMLAGLADWRPVVLPQLNNPANRRRAIDVIARVGASSDAAVLRPFLEEREGGSEQVGTVIRSVQEVRNVALRALDNLDDCSVIERVRQLALDPGVDMDAKLNATSYIRRCNGSIDLGGLEAIAQRTLSGQGPSQMSNELSVLSMVRTLYDRSGPSSLPAIRRILAAWPMSRFKVEALKIVMEPDGVVDLRAALSASNTAVRAAAGVALAARGDLAGIPVIAQIAQDSSQSNATRAEALGALLFVKGPSIRTLAIALAKGGTDADVHAAAIRGLRWYADDETLRILLDAFKDSDRIVREAALESWAVVPTDKVADWVGSRQNELSIGARVYATRIIQLRGRDRYSEVYRSLLSQADSSMDYPALAQALIGLRDAYLIEPVATAVGALSDPMRGIRLAATLALADHPDRAKAPQLLRDAEATAPVPSSVRRAEWAVGVGARGAELRDQIRSALASGQVQKAGALSGLVNGPQSGYLAGLLFGLSSVRTSAIRESAVIMRDWHLFDELFFPPASARLQQAEVTLRRGLTSSVVPQLTTYVAQNPHLRQLIRDDQRFAALRDQYQFRVLTGLQPPLTFDGALKQ